MLLYEILTNNTEMYDIFEDYGNLKIIDKKFQRALKIPTTISVPHDSETGYSNATLHKPIKGFGQNSKVNSLAIKSNSQLVNSLTNPDVIGAVLSINEVQVAVFTKTGISATAAYTIGMDYAAIEELFLKSEPLIISEILQIFGTKVRATPGWSGRPSSISPLARTDDLEIVRGAKQAQLVKLTAWLLLNAKGQSLQPKLLTIEQDHVGDDTSKSRTVNRRGASAIESKNSRFAQLAKSGLSHRLELFKANKALGVASIDQLIDAIHENGYLDKIKIAGFPYTLCNSEIRLEYLKNPTKHNLCYVQYQMNERSAEYKKLYDDTAAIYKQFAHNEEAQKAANAEYCENIPPVRLSITLKLEGGTIVPSEIKIDRKFDGF